MFSTVSRLALAAVAAALTACSPHAPAAGATRPGDAAPAASVAASSPAPALSATVDDGQLGAAISASQLPRARAGQWTTLVTMAGQPDATESHCETGVPPDIGEAACPGMTLHRTVTGGYVIAGDCPVGPSRMLIRAHIEGDFSTHIDSQTTVTTTGANAGAQSIHRASRYAGPCVE